MARLEYWLGLGPGPKARLCATLRATGGRIGWGHKHRRAVAWQYGGARNSGTGHLVGHLLGRMVVVRVLLRWIPNGLSATLDLHGCVSHLWRDGVAGVQCGAPCEVDRTARLLRDDPGRPNRRSFQPVGATGLSRSWLKASAGVRHPSVLRGRPLSWAAVACRVAGSLGITKTAGRYWRRRPLVFSLVPRSHGDRG